MKYEYNAKRIKKAIDEYKTAVDKQADLFKARNNNFQRQLDNMKAEGKYTNEYLSKYEKENAPKNTDIISNVADSRKKSKDVCERCLNEIKKELDAYINAPVSQEFATKIQSVNSVGLKLSNHEFDLLKGQASTYMEMRLLKQLAENRTKTVQDRSLSKEELENLDKATVYYKEKEVNDSYAIEIPDMDTLYDGLKEFETNVLFTLQYYCGEKGELSRLLCTENDLIWAANGDVFFRNQYGTLTTFVSLFDGANEILESFKTRKKELTQEEIDLIDMVIDPKYPSLARNGVLTAAKKNPYMREILKLDDRYNQYVFELEEIEDRERVANG